jgi:cytochrome b pre-mRNA-processing protein 3
MLKALWPLTGLIKPGLLNTSLLKPRPQVLTGRALYAEAVNQARQPAFYLDYGVRDEIGARFELLCLHVILLITTLRGKGVEADEVGQAVFDGLMQGLDDTLREQGVGDISVPKKMKKIIQSVYTRLSVWDGFWTSGAENSEQSAYIRDTIYAIGDEDAPIEHIEARVAAMFDYVSRARQSLTSQALQEGQAAWPEITKLDLETHAG